MAEFPALPLWTDAYLADTGHLSFAEHGAYLRLLMEAWSGADGLPPADVDLEPFLLCGEIAWRHVDWSAHPARLLTARWRKIRKAVLENHRGGCVFCGDPDRLEVDHIIPRYAGGTHAWDNLQVLCRPCNASKGGRL